MALDVFREHKWELPETLFVIAGCFAMGALGFLAAVWLQTRVPGITTYGNSQEVPVAMKEKVLQQVSTSDLSSSPVDAVRNQSDEKDENADAKLKLLQKLDASQ